MPVAEPDIDRTHPARLTSRAIARFHLPLVVNAWLVTAAGPLLDAALGRAADPHRQLAAFWLAFGVLLFAESACLVLPQATAATLARGRALAPIALGAALASALASALVLAIARTPLGEPVFATLLAAPAPVAALARETLAPMALVPPLVALRGVAAGVSVRAHRTGPLALATLVRVLALAALVVGVMTGALRADAIAAAWAMVLASAAEAAIVALAAFGARDAGAHAPTSRDARARATRDADARADAGVDARGRGALAHPLAAFARLALPLAAASLVWNVTRPLASALVGRLDRPELAQAAFGVVLPLLMSSCAPLWALLDAALVLPASEADVRRLARWAFGAALVFAAAIALVAWTPLRDLALGRALALTPALAAVIAPALGLLVLEPFALAARALAQGLLVRAERTGFVLAVAPLRLALMLVGGLALARLAPHANPAVFALALFVAGDAFEAVLYGVAVVRTGAHHVRPATAPAPVSPTLPIEEAA